MKRCRAVVLTFVFSASLGACDHFESPSPTQCEEAVKRIVAEATLKSPDKAQCERSMDNTLPGARKRPAPREKGMLGRIGGALDDAVGKIKGAAHRLSNEYEEAVGTCEKDWTLATAQCVEKAGNPGQAKDCKATGKAQAKAYTAGLITCETGWNMALVTCINQTSAPPDTAACLAWPWSSPDATILALLGDAAPKAPGEAPATN